MKRLIALLMAIVLTLGNAFAVGNDLVKPRLYGPGTQNPTLSPYHEYFLDAHWTDATANCGDVRLYAYPDDGSDCLTVIPYGAALLTADYSAKYCYACYNLYEGFIDWGEIDIGLPDARQFATSSAYRGAGRIVNCNEYVSLREYPSARYASLCSVPLGAQVDVYDYNDDFYLCSYDGKLGYIKREYISLFLTFTSSAQNGRSAQDTRPVTDTYAPTGYLALFQGLGPTAYQSYIDDMDNDFGRRPNNATLIDGFEIGEYATICIAGHRNSFTQQGFFDMLFSEMNGSYSDMNAILDDSAQAVASNCSAYDFHLVGTELYAWGVDFDGGTSVFEEYYAFEATRGNTTYLLCAEFFMYAEGGEGINLQCLSQY